MHVHQFHMHIYVFILCISSDEGQKPSNMKFSVIDPIFNFLFHIKCGYIFNIYTSVTRGGQTVFKFDYFVIERLVSCNAIRIYKV